MTPHFIVTLKERATGRWKHMDFTAESRQGVVDRLRAGNFDQNYEIIAITPSTEQPPSPPPPAPPAPPPSERELLERISVSLDRIASRPPIDGGTMALCIVFGVLIALVLHTLFLLSIGGRLH